MAGKMEMRLSLATFVGAVVASASFCAHAQSPSASQEQAMVQAALQKPAEVYFDGCDGYGQVAKSGDGMTAEALGQFGIRPMLEIKDGDTVRRTPKFGVQGIGDCGAALSDLQSFPQYWMRKVSLLRARSLHRFALGDAAGADADLAAAEAAVAVPSDPFYARSLKLGLAFQRAYYLSRAGRQAEAEALAMAAWAERPYSREATYAARVAIGPAASAETLQKLDANLEMLDPGHRGPPLFLLPAAPPDAVLPTLPSAATDEAALYSVLPEAETAQRIAPAPAGAHNDGDCRDSGCRAAESPMPVQDPGISASFYGLRATVSIAEEQSLLSAAMAVRQVGKRYFVIVQRADAWHMRTRNLWACPYRSDGLEPKLLRALGANDEACNWTDTYAAGFETGLEVQIADTGPPAPGASQTQPPILDADAIYAALGPVYLGSAPGSH